MAAEDGAVNGAVLRQDGAGASAKLLQSVERDDAEPLSDMRRDDGIEIVQAPHPLGQHRRGENRSRSAGR